MKTRLIVPVLAALTACGDNLHPDEDQVQVNSEEEGGGHDDDGPPRAINAGIGIMTETCERTVAHYEAFASYTDDNSPATNIACVWTFDDGATSTACTGSHQFAIAGSHDFVLEVTDLDSGATARSTQTRIFHPPLALTLEVSSTDLTISYTAVSNTGGEQVVFVSPDALVIADDPNYPRTTIGTVRVTEAGTYTVTYDVEDERGVSEICSGRLTRTIDVACDKDNVGH